MPTLIGAAESYIFIVTELIDWRDDASLPSRTLTWHTWLLAMCLLSVVMAAIVVVVTGPVSGSATSFCRWHEAREGVQDLEKIDVPAIGSLAPAKWVPPAGVQVRFVQSHDVPRGTVLDLTRCANSEPTGPLQVVVAK